VNHAFVADPTPDESSPQCGSRAVFVGDMKGVRGQSHDANITEAAVDGLTFCEIALEEGAEVTAYCERRQFSIPYVFATDYAIGVGVENGN
jgi:hypothetical protein